ncbi:MAG: bifunctional UDP-3-O-[3-hydroxymyristoyl] N-acetylglucosamine deacetylase/3-hydroxyacyl-ACP dehydratase [Gemmatimonadota bacterium]
MRGHQRTIGQRVSTEGLGLHTGEPVRTVLLPAPVDSGLVFRRMDLDGEPRIPGDVDEVTGVEWETVLGPHEKAVRTVEHLLAAAAAARIDNMEIQLEGPEPPALDGSASGWCRLLREAGRVEQEAEATVLAVSDPIHVTSNGSRYAALPYDGYRVSAGIEFDNPVIGRQFVSIEVAEDPFCREIAPARTFGLERWREELRSRGLALGASHENTIVVTEAGLAPEAELRFPDEFVRHKIIDLIGDLALVGARIQAHIVAERPGHRGNVELARRLREAGRSYSRITAEPVLDIQKILDYIPHRYPFLLVDRIVEFEAGRRIVGLKNVTINEPFFTGHFPDHPIMPGVLIVEAMAQVGGLLLMNEFDNPQDKVVYFMSLDDVKFRRPVMPGDQIVFELEMLQRRGRTCRMRGVGKVDGQPVAQATMMAMVRDR